MTTLPDYESVRRSLLTTHLRLSEGMAPEIFRWSEMAAHALGLTKPVEIYQAAGEENAANHTCESVVFVSLQGRLISSLDEGSFLALFGHEFGHHIAHTSPFVGTTRLAAIRFGSSIACDASLSPDLRVLGSRVAMAKEITADRFGAIASGGIDGAVRLMMAIVTGLPAERLRNDIPAYLAQARAIFDDAKAKTKTIGTHPEHLLRAYALALFAESDLYKELTGQGTGARTIAEVDAILKSILVGELDEKAGESPEALLAALRDLGLDARPLSGAVSLFEDMSPSASELLPEGVALSENAVIGFFPQSSSDLLQDYDELLQRLDPKSTDSLEGSLNAACDLLPSSHRPGFSPVPVAANSSAKAVSQSKRRRWAKSGRTSGNGSSLIDAAIHDGFHRFRPARLGGFPLFAGTQPTFLPAVHIVIRWLLLFTIVLFGSRLAHQDVQERVRASRTSPGHIAVAGAGNATSLSRSIHLREPIYFDF